MHFTNCFEGKLCKSFKHLLQGPLARCTRGSHRQCNQSKHEPTLRHNLPDVNLLVTESVETKRIDNPCLSSELLPHADHCTLPISIFYLQKNSSEQFVAPVFRHTAVRQNHCTHRHSHLLFWGQTKNGYRGKSSDA